MSKYEMMMIYKPDLDSARDSELTDKLKAIVENNGCNLVEVVSWGKKELATPMNKLTHGNYQLFYYEGEGGPVNKAVEDFMKITDDLVRHLIIKIDNFPQGKVKETAKA